MSSPLQLPYPHIAVVSDFSALSEEPYLTKPRNPGLAIPRMTALDLNLLLKSVILSLSKDQFGPILRCAQGISKKLSRRFFALTADYARNFAQNLKIFIPALDHPHSKTIAKITTATIIDRDKIPAKKNPIHTPHFLLASPKP